MINIKLICWDYVILTTNYNQFYSEVNTRTNVHIVYVYYIALLNVILHLPSGFANTVIYSFCINYNEAYIGTD